MLTARDVAELAAAQDGWVDPVNNLVCADTGGRIAYQCRGELPVRSSDAGTAAAGARLGRRVRVDGDRPVRRAARGDRPRGGVRDDRQQRDHRRRRAVHLLYVLASRGGPSGSARCWPAPAATAPTELAGMQADTVSLGGAGWGRLLGGLGPCRRRRTPRRRGRCWPGFDGDLAAGSAARAALRLLPAGAGRGALPAGARRRDLGLADLGRRCADAVDGPPLAGNDTWELLGGPVPPAGAAPTRARPRPSGGTGCSPRCRPRWPAAWAAAVGRGRPDPGRWRWGDVHRAVQVHPLAGPVPPAVPMGGDADTVQAAGYGWRPGGPFTVTTCRCTARWSTWRARRGELRHPRRRVRRPGQPALRRPARPLGRAPADPDAGAGRSRVSGARRRRPRRRWQVLVVVVRVASVRCTQPCDHSVRLPPWNAMPPAAKNVAHGIASW